MKYDDFEKLTNLVRSASIRMITVDTNILRENGYRFDSGLLGQLTKFKDSRFELVISAIVVREMQRQIAEKISENLVGWPKIHRVLQTINLTTKATVRLEGYVAKINPQAEADRQVEQFLLNTAAEVVSTDHAKMEDVLNLYFDRRSPFGKAGKKSEFPDAIALLGLEEWAKAGLCGMIVVSRDTDWISFCEERDNPLYIVQDLEKALEIINASETERSERSQARHNSMVDRWISGEFKSEAANQLRSLLLEHVKPKGLSEIEHTAEITKIDMRYSSISDPILLRSDDFALVLMFNFHTPCKFWARFDFRSLIAEQYLGSGTYDIEQTIDSMVLLTVTDEKTIVEVLLKKEDISIDFGIVKPKI